MKTILSSISLLALLLFTGSCKNKLKCVEGEGEIATRTIDLQAITGIEIRSAANVVLTQGSEQEIVVHGHNNILDIMTFDIVNGTWIIDFEECLKEAQEVEVEVTIPVLRAARISGAGTITATNHFSNPDDVELTISGSGDIDLGIDAPEINSTISGSGPIRLSGNTGTHNFSMPGSGNLFAFNLNTNTTNIDIGGSGDAEVRVDVMLDVKISGSGTVYYKGNPIVVSAITGAGEVIDAN